MLDFNAALELMAKYGYSSSTSHPYIYEAGESIGLCYLYNDEDFGTLERVKIFDSLEAFEDFLKQLDWVKKNGLLYHVRMALDNYEIMNPKPIFLRNEKIMVEGEMYDIDNFDLRESQRSQMDDPSKVVFEAGDLLLIYDEIKNRQIQYFSSIVSLKNELREKYYELQKEIDIYNKVKVDRNLTLLPDVPDSGGIDEMLEIAIKDRYNLYVAQRPSLEEAQQFLKEVWDLNYKIESNIRYYDAQKEENEIRNELKVVAQKMEFMQKLNEDLRPLFGVDLVKKFRRINKICKDTSTTISDESIKEKLKLIEKKYSYFKELDHMYASDYLREAIQNTNYDDLAVKYGKGVSFETANKARLPMHDVAASLSVQYRDRLSVDEQAILVLYNNEKIKKICNAILNVENFDTAPLKTIMKAVSGVKGLSKLKSECYVTVKARLEDPINATIKNSLFGGFDLTTFETFVESLTKGLAKLKNVNNKMVLNGDINMYLLVRKPEDVLNKKFITVTNDLTTLLHDKGNSMIGITLLKYNLPVLYSPYYLDIGDIYSKDASPQMFIKEMVNFELLVEQSDVNLNLDENKVEVVKYQSDPIVEGNIYIVKELKATDKTIFCKFAISTRLTEDAPVEALPVAQPVPEEVQPAAPDVATAPVEPVQTEQPAAPVSPATPDVAVPVVPQQEVVQAPVVAEPAVQPIVNTPVVEQPVVSQPVVEAPVEAPVQPVQPQEPVVPEPELAPVEEKAVLEETPTQPVIEEVKAPIEEAKDEILEEITTESKPDIEKTIVEEPVVPIIDEITNVNESIEENKTEEVKEEKPVVEQVEKKVEEKPQIIPEESKEEKVEPPKKEEVKEEPKPVVDEGSDAKKDITPDEKAKLEEEELSNRLDEFLSSVPNMNNTIYKNSISKSKEKKETQPVKEEDKKPVETKPTESASAPKPTDAKPVQPTVIKKPAQQPVNTAKPTASPAVKSQPVQKAEIAQVATPVVKKEENPNKVTAPTTAPAAKPAPVAQSASVAKPVAPVAKAPVVEADSKKAVQPVKVAPAAKTAVAPKPVAATTKPVQPAAVKPVASVSKPAAPAAKPVANIADAKKEPVKVTAPVTKAPASTSKPVETKPVQTAVPAKPAQPAAAVKPVASVSKPVATAAKPTTVKTTTTVAKPATATTVEKKVAPSAPAAKPAALAQPVKKVVVAKNISKPVTQVKKEGE